MSSLHRMLLGGFFPVLILSIAFFSLILQLVDLFPHFWRFAIHNVGIDQIAQIAWLYVPTTIRFSLPIGLLFATTYTLGKLYTRNELIAVLGSGMSLRQFASPLLVIGFFACPLLLILDEEVGSRALRKKTELFQSVVKQRISLSNADVTVIGTDGNQVIHAEYYNDRERTLTGLMIMGRTEDGRFMSRIDAEQAVWIEDQWVLSGVRRYRWNPITNGMSQENILQLGLPGNNDPDTFRRGSRDVGNMSLREGFEWVKTLRKSGLPYRAVQTDIYGKAAFTVTPIVISLLAIAAGGLVKRNVLLGSMLIALGSTVSFFVVRMVFHILSKSDLIPPLFGASAAPIVFLIIGLVLLIRIRT